MATPPADDWVDPKYNPGDLQGDNPPVGGEFSCLRFPHVPNCQRCEKNRKGKRIGRDRQRGCAANWKANPQQLARLKQEYEAREQGEVQTGRRRKSKRKKDDDVDYTQDSDNETTTKTKRTKSASRHRSVRRSTTSQRNSSIELEPQNKALKALRLKLKQQATATSNWKKSSETYQ